MSTLLTEKGTQTRCSDDDVENQHQPTKDAQSSSKEPLLKALGWLDRLLALWIFLAMAIGIILGTFVPSTGPALQKGKFADVSVPIGKSADLHFPSLTYINALAVGLLVMMYPILCKVRYESLHKLLARRAMWRQILFSVILNWIVAPFLMVRLALLSWNAYACSNFLLSLDLHGPSSQTKVNCELGSSLWALEDVSPW